MSKIPEVMLAKATSPAIAPQYFTTAYRLQEKFDGDRAVLAIGAHASSFISGRSGNSKSASFPDLAGIGIPALAGTVLDGEFLAPPLDGEPYASIGKTTGWFNSGVTASRMLRIAYKRAPIFRVFDVLAVAGVPVIANTYDERQAVLTEIIPKILAAYPDCGIELVPDYPATAQMFAVMLAKGAEGIVLKLRSGRYLPGKRSDLWRKVKAVQTIDVALTGAWKPGKGGRVNTVGAVEVAVMALDGSVRPLGYVGVKPNLATAYTDPDTHGLREGLAGTVWEVEANGIYDAALRFPRYLRTRTDKSLADCGTEQLDALLLAA